jgi:putative redox protein
MKMKLVSSTEPLNYVGLNENGHSISLSGNGKAVGPMESVLLAAASCSAIDVELILGKMRQDLQRLEVDVEGKRAEDQIPKVFTDIHLHYILYGEIKQSKAASAVEKSVLKYCSVLTMLKTTVNVTFSFEVKDGLE